MMENINYALYFNLFFFGLIGVGMLIGFLRGLKTTLYSFIVKLLFYIIFFATLGAVVNFLWRVPMPFLSEALSGINNNFSSVSNLRDALPIAMEMFLGDTLNATLENDNFLAFATALSLFVVKIFYTIFYFTIFKLFYHFTFFIIRMIFFRTKKEDRFKSKKRVPGIAVGAASGFLSVFMTLILLGGMMDVTTNLVSLLDEASDDPTEVALNNDNETSSNGGLIEIPANLEDDVAEVREMTTAYNSNPFVRLISAWTHKTTNDEGEIIRETPQNLRLFDMVFSIDYDETSIAFRHEISVVSGMAGVFLNSEYAQTNNFSDLSGDEFRDAFNYLSSSDLFVSILPLAIEVGADYGDMELPVNRDTLYAIDWASEVATMGAILGTMVEIFHGAGVFDEEDAYQTATFDGDDFRSIFNDISETDVFTLGAHVGMDVLLNAANNDISMVLSVPDGVVWEDEFKAFGEIIGSFADTDLTLKDVQDQDYNTMFLKLSTMDLRVILQSQFISEAMINVLSGQGDLMNVEQILIPDDILWRDVYEGDTLETEGELRKVLNAMNAVAGEAATLDLENLDLNLIMEFDTALFDTVFESSILESSIGNLVYELTADVAELRIPNSVLKSIMVNELNREIVMKEEIITLIDTIQLLNIEDFEHLEFSASILEGLADEDIETLFDSKIMHATLSNVMFDLMEGEDAFMIVPYYDSDDDAVRVYDAFDEFEYITTGELSNLLKALIALDITNNFDDLSNLDLIKINENITDILASAILHASVSKQLLDIGEDTVIVPESDEDGNAIRLLIGENDEETLYIEKDELIATLDALEILDLTSVDGFGGGVSLGAFSEDRTNIDVVLTSSILQATMSQQLIDMAEGPSETIVIPFFDATDSTNIRFIVEGTDYILRDELSNLINALVTLELTDDVDSFDGNVDLMILANDLSRQEVLDSSIMQATISKQLFDMHDQGTLTVPNVEEDDTTSIRVLSGTGPEETSFIVRNELDDVINAIILLLGDETTGELLIDSFDGSVNLEMLGETPEPGEDSNKEIVLASNIIRATMSKQMLDSASIHIPDRDFNDTRDIHVTVDSGSVDEVTYILSDELDFFIDALILLEVYDIDTYDGGIDISRLDTEPAKDELLLSAIMHATVTDILISLDDAVLIIPTLMSDDITPLIEMVSATEFVINDEIKALINGFLAMGYTTLGDFGLEIESEKFFNNREVLLESYGIQATISDKLINDTGGNLLIPDEDINNNTVRISVDGGSYIYIEIDEMNAVFDALDTLGLYTFSDVNLTADLVLGGVDIAILLESVSVQLTLSDTILSNAQDETLLPNNDMTLVVTSNFHETLTAGGLNYTQIESTEIFYLLTALELLGADFDGAMDASAISAALNDMNTILLSGSMHITIDNMIKSNPNIVVPDLAVKDTTFNMVENVTTAQEIETFITAADIIVTQTGSGDFTNVTFTMSEITNLSETQQSTVLDSMIVRNVVTDEVEAFLDANYPGGSAEYFDNADYEENDPTTFLTKPAIERAIDEFY